MVEPFPEVCTEIPLAKPEIIDADRDAVLAVLRTSALSMGPKLMEFERAMAAYLGGVSAVVVNSGTSALHLALKVLNVPRGSQVVLPSFTFSAVLNVLLQEQLSPVFAEIDASTFNLSAETVEAQISERTRAIIAVHTFGRPTAADDLRELAKSRGIVLIEDACEALGAEIRGRKAATLGDAGVLAFYPNKLITAGEGGMLLTPDPKLADRARRLRNQGRDPSLDWFQHAEPGYSYRLSEMNCALGLQQLQRIEENIARRQRLAASYDRELVRVAGVVRPQLGFEHGRVSWFCYVVLLPEWTNAAGRDWICKRLLQRGIQTGRYFAPLHRQPVLGSRPRPDLPVTDGIASRALALPFFNQLTEDEVGRVCAALEESLNELEDVERTANSPES